MSLVLAHNNVVQVGLRLTSPTDLDAFCDRATSNPRVGKRLEDLRIVMNGQLSRTSLRRCLDLAPNLVDLDLLLSNPDVPGLLDGVLLPDLRFFRTNIPHALLIDFFSDHTRLSVLILDVCAAPQGPCPLSVTRLHYLKCISGPGRCVAQLLNPNVSRLTMTSVDSAYSTSLILSSVPSRLASLSTLTIDFRADGHDVLQSIITTCPNVRKLKLLEVPGLGRRRNPTRRAWNDGAMWSKALLGLPLLEELMLRTATSLVRRMSGEDDERKVLMQWVTGVRSATRGRANPHPNLYHVGVWYCAEDANGGVVTHWSNRSGSWVRSAILVNPGAGYDFV